MEQHWPSSLINGMSSTNHLYFIVQASMLDDQFNFCYGHNDPIPFQCLILDKIDDIGVWFRVN